mmetsp:Transcript_143683/g.264005  ORF Transcript_143683/g.264005 Transcript_143683/m.264005 type:complete len:211 (-) Transcript_143683:88-720(-)
MRMRQQTRKINRKTGEPEAPLSVIFQAILKASRPIGKFAFSITDIIQFPLQISLLVLDALLEIFLIPGKIIPRGEVFNEALSLKKLASFIRCSIVVRGSVVHVQLNHIPFSVNDPDLVLPLAVSELLAHILHLDVESIPDACVRSARFFNLADCHHIIATQEQMDIWIAVLDVLGILVRTKLVHGDLISTRWHVVKGDRLRSHPIHLVSV